MSLPSTPTIPIGQFEGVPVRITVGHLAMVVGLTILIPLSDVFTVALSVIDAYTPYRLMMGGWIWNIGTAFSTVLAVFSIQTLFHELGHVRGAVQHGVDVEQVVLRAGGGATVLKGDPPSPKAELWTVGGGPIGSLAAIGVFNAIYILGTVTGIPAVATVAALSSVATIGLTATNLVPVFALDGGRILRAVLASRLGFRHATRSMIVLSYSTGLGVAVMGVLSGYYGLLLVWLFVLVTTPGLVGVPSEYRPHEHSAAPNTQ